MLNVENLCVNYGAIKAVRNVSFHVEKGEIVSIIGNNGAGKSSTLRALTGIVKPASGSIRLFDQEIAQTKAHKICNMGMAMCPGRARHLYAHDRGRKPRNGRLQPQGQGRREKRL